MNFELTTHGEFGYFFLKNSNQIHGLWFAQESYAHNSTKIMAIISMLGVHARSISDEDYVAATTGLCKISTIPQPPGGCALWFPSSNVKDDKKKRVKKWWKFWV